MIDTTRLPQPSMNGEQIFVAPKFNGYVPASPKRTLGQQLGDMINLASVCPANQIDSDQPELVKAINNAGGKPLFIPPGVQIRPTATIVPPNGSPLTIFGFGNGFGPGTAVQDESMSSLLRPIFGGGPVFDIQGNYPCLFEGFRGDLHPNFRNVSGQAAKNTGAFFRIRGPNGGVNSSTVFRDVAIVGKAGCIDMQGTFTPTIDACKFMDWSGRAVSITSYPGVEGNAGEISGCNWFGQGMNPDGSLSCLYLEVGYGHIHHNFIGGGDYAIQAAIKGSNAGGLRIDHNVMEDQYAGSMRFASQDGSTLCVAVENNWMSVLNPAYTATFAQHIIAEDNGSDWLADSSFSRNIMRSGLASSSRYIWIESGRNVDVEGNQLVNIGANSPRGLDIYGPASSAQLKKLIRVGGNKFAGTFSSKYAFAPGAVKFDHTDPDMVFADVVDGALGGVLDGSRCFATDGSPSSFAGGGSGAFYKRQGGVWVPA